MSEFTHSAVVLHDTNCREGHLSVVKYLKEKGANPNHEDKRNQTPFLFAVR